MLTVDERLPLAIGGFLMVVHRYHANEVLLQCIFLEVYGSPHLSTWIVFVRTVYVNILEHWWTWRHKVWEHYGVNWRRLCQVAKRIMSEDTIFVCARLVELVAIETVKILLLWKHDDVWFVVETLPRRFSMLPSLHLV